MHYLIAGGSGFIGQALCQHALAQGINCSVIGRDRQRLKQRCDPRVKVLTWDDLDTDSLSYIEQADLVLNLCGANIGAKPWHTKRRQVLRTSRLDTTSLLSEALAKLGKDAPPLFNASGIGIYGLQQHADLDNYVDEQTHLDPEQHQEFVADLARAWEHATHVARQSSVRVVNLRLAPVLGAGGGILNQLVPMFRLGLGGRLGHGQQAFSWVALADVVRAIDFLIAYPEIEGPVNIVAPQCVTQRQFAQRLAKQLKRPCILATPAWLLNLCFGQMADELLLKGQAVKPSVLLKHGFTFNHPQLNSALKDALK